jgi:hypothetical protein
MCFSSDDDLDQGMASLSLKEKSDDVNGVNKGKKEKVRPLFFIII